MHSEPILVELPHNPADDPQDFFYEEDGIFVKVIPFRVAGIGRVGHKHTYDHTSFVAAGALRWWKDGVDQGIVRAPMGIRIEAGCFHKFVAVADNSVLMCVHNTHGLPQDQLEGALVKEYHQG